MPKWHYDPSRANNFDKIITKFGAHIYRSYFKSSLFRNEKPVCRRGINVRDVYFLFLDLSVESQSFGLRLASTPEFLSRVFR